MHREELGIDDQVLAARRRPTPNGMPAMMNPKLISRHIGLITATGRGGESAGCHSRSRKPGS